MSIFHASVQYNDFRGTVAADRSDTMALSNYLAKQGVANQHERVVGCRIAFSENHGREVTPGVVIYLQEGRRDDSATSIRAVEVEMTMGQFFSFFKRFDMVMTVDGDKFDGVEVDGPHYD